MNKSLIIIIYYHHWDNHLRQMVVYLEFIENFVDHYLKYLDYY